MDVRASRQLRFPPFRLDPDNACLWRGFERPLLCVPEKDGPPRLCGLVRAELNEDAADGGLRYVGGAPYRSVAAGWVRHLAASVGAAWAVSHNHAVRVW